MEKKILDEDNLMKLIEEETKNLKKTFPRTHALLEDSIAHLRKSRQQLRIPFLEK